MLCFNPILDCQLYVGMVILCQHTLREAQVQKRLFSRCFKSNDFNKGTGLIAAVSLFRNDVFLSAILSPLFQMHTVPL